MDVKSKDIIKKLMSGSYEPSLADCNRIYKEYSLNKGEMAVVLSDVFGWLAQAPYSCNYKRGALYLRAEADVQQILCVHYIYANDNGIILDEKVGLEDDMSPWPLAKYSSIIKEMITEELGNMEIKYSEMSNEEIREITFKRCPKKMLQI